MKRTLVASILGAVASLATVASSYGQGQVVFNTYVGTVYQPIKYTSDSTKLFVTDAGLAGTTVDNQFSAELYYALGSGFTSLSQLTALPASISLVNNAGAANTRGFVLGSAVDIPGYVSGPVTFAIVAWKSSGAHSENGYNVDPLNAYQGASGLWTESSIAASPSPADFFQVNLPALAVSAVPEPSMLALGGLGSAALLMFRRRK